MVAIVVLFGLNATAANRSIVCRERDQPTNPVDSADSLERGAEGSPKRSSSLVAKPAVVDNTRMSHHTCCAYWLRTQGSSAMVHERRRVGRWAYSVDILDRGRAAAHARSWSDAHRLLNEADSQASLGVEDLTVLATAS